MIMERPFGVTILAILAGIEALGCFAMAALVGTLFAWLETSWVEYGYGPSPFTGIGLAVTAIAAIIGLVYLLIAWGLWTGRGWAWIVMMIFAILGLIGSIIALIVIVGIIPLIINILILYYLTRPHVKAFFGRGPPPEGPPPPPP